MKHHVKKTIMKDWLTTTPVMLFGLFCASLASTYTGVLMGQEPEFVFHVGANIALFMVFYSLNDASLIKDSFTNTALLCMLLWNAYLRSYLIILAIMALQVTT